MKKTQTVKKKAGSLTDNEGNRKILPIDNVEVEWTDKDKHHVNGSKSMLHRELANKLSEAGKCKIVEGGKEQQGTTQDETEGQEI